MRFLILVFYFERPQLLKRALDSVFMQGHEDWEMCIIDDGILLPARDVLTQKMRSKNRISLVETNDSQHSKTVREKRKGAGGSVFGAYANAAVSSCDASHAIMLCDDDALKDGYLSDLSDFYRRNPETNYSYCHLDFVDPYTGLIVENEYTKYLNSKDRAIHPVNELDSSQVSWNVNSWRKANISFPHPQTSSLDREIYQQMYESWGPCVFNGIVGQTKGIHEKQLMITERMK